MSQYGDSIRFEYHNFPFLSPTSNQAALAAEAAGQQGKFYEMHDLLFENQADWSRASTPNVLFLRYAEEIGLDLEEFRRHQQASLLRDKVQADFSEGSDRGVTGTPTFFLNGERLTYSTYEEFIAQVAAAATGEVSTSTEPVSEDAGPEVRFGL
jgi:protein-disulfide isomerase